MFNQNRIYRLFQLIVFLRARPPKSIRSLSSFLSTSERSTYRYIDLLKGLGFSVEKDRNGRFSIINTDIQIPFTEAEVDFLKKTLNNSLKTSKLAKSILEKIDITNEADANSENLYNAHLSKVIEEISIAMAENKQIKIKSYFSASSQTIEDRIVEPVCFTDSYQSISAYEIKTKQNKYFNIERIGDIEILPNDIAHQSQHEYFKPDIFGFQGKSLDKEIELKLSMRAYLILKDDYPMSAPYIKKLNSRNQYLLKAQVQSFKAPARFVKGLQEDILVVGSKDFINYLKKVKP
jgi:proteasome accessory factor C